MHNGKQRRLPSPPRSSSIEQSRIPVLSKSSGSREKLVTQAGTSPPSATSQDVIGAQKPTKVAKGGRGKPPLVKARSREFIDVVKQFEGGRLPDRVLRSVDEERQMKDERRLKDCEEQLREISRHLDETEEEYQEMRMATERIKFHLSEVHSLKTVMRLPVRR